MEQEQNEHQLSIELSEEIQKEPIQTWLLLLTPHQSLLLILYG